LFYDWGYDPDYGYCPGGPYFSNRDDRREAELLPAVKACNDKRIEERPSCFPVISIEASDPQ
jgi:pullulanase/glycogen debranching enzyme